MPRTARYGFFAMLATLVAAALLTFDRPLPAQDKPARPQQRAVPVTVGDAVLADVPVLLSAIGNVEASATVEIKSRVNGQLMTVHFREGQDVKQGDILFTIDRKPLEAAVREARGKLERNKALLKKAEEDNRRYENLMRQNIISRDQFETVATNLSSLQAQVRADEATLESAEVEHSYSVIRSPINGRTGRLLVHAGNMVKANADSGMVIIQQVEPVDVRFSVPEARLPEVMQRLRAGPPPVKAAPPGSEAVAETGLLTFVDNEVDTKTGTILLKATFDNRERRLWPGQFVNVVLETGTRKGAVMVPSQAVQPGAEGDYVYVVKPDNTVEYRVVATGETQDGRTIVTRGLSGGEKVVTDGQLRLTPGAAVEIRQPGTSGAKPQGNSTAKPEAAQ